LILARSPRAKDRARRGRGVFLDRSVKALRLERFNNLGAASALREARKVAGAGSAVHGCGAACGGVARRSG